MENEQDIRERLLKIGFDKTTVDNAFKGKGTKTSLLQTIEDVNLQQCDKKTGTLLFTFTSKLTPNTEKWRKPVAQYIIDQKIANPIQLEYAFEFMQQNIVKKELDWQQFEQFCGVGIVLTQDQIKQGVQEFINENKEELLNKRYSYNFSELMKNSRQYNKFAEGAALTKELKQQWEDLLGPKTEEDLAKKPVQKQEKEQKKEEEPKYKLSEIVGRDMASALNSEETLKWKTDNFGDGILTRFPPEPNGYLHIGHAKAINFNFTLAKQYNGKTYLRFDDTNPDKESKEYIDNIIENLRFLGFQPWKITYSSDYFNQLYDYAEELIKKGKAYTCFLPKEKASELRNNKLPSPYRDTPPEECLRIFRRMKLGLYKENQVCLRGKIDYAHVNPTLRDPPFYRIRYTPHPHCKDNWCIYPLYDYCHCICDSIEGITHSCCTLEFEIRRELYYWILEQLNLYRPFVWEYSRLNVSNTVLSKRKLHKLIFEKYVSGWDDPRILTLNGLRRRGYTPESINEFCELVGVTRRGNENIIGMHLLEHCIRKDLDIKAKRTMAVLDPILATITNLESDEEIEVNDFPKFPDKGKHKIKLTKQVYLDNSDVKLQDQKEFWGAAPGKLIGLKGFGPFKVTDVIGQGDKVKEVILERIKGGEKPKGMLHWISKEEGVECEVRVYDTLFNEYDVNSLDDFLDGLSDNSIVVYKNSLMHKDLLKCKIEEKYQFERVGYFVVDKDTDVEKGKFVWNRTVTLQEREKIKATGQKEKKK